MSELAVGNSVDHAVCTVIIPLRDYQLGSPVRIYVVNGKRIDTVGIFLLRRQLLIQEPGVNGLPVVRLCSRCLHSRAQHRCRGKAQRSGHSSDISHSDHPFSFVSHLLLFTKPDDTLFYHKHTDLSNTTCKVRSFLVGYSERQHSR